MKKGREREREIGEREERENNNSNIHTTEQHFLFDIATHNMFSVMLMKNNRSTTNYLQIKKKRRKQIQRRKEKTSTCIYTINFRTFRTIKLYIQILNSNSYEK